MNLWAKIGILVAIWGITVGSATGKELSLFTERNGSLDINETALTPQMQDGYQTMVAHCFECHDLNRMLKRMQATYATNEDAFRDGLKATLVKKLKYPGSSLTTKDAKKILTFFIELRRLKEITGD